MFDSRSYSRTAVICCRLQPRNDWNIPGIVSFPPVLEIPKAQHLFHGEARSNNKAEDVWRSLKCFRTHTSIASCGKPVQSLHKTSSLSHVQRCYYKSRRLLSIGMLFAPGVGAIYRWLHQSCEKFNPDGCEKGINQDGCDLLWSDLSTGTFHL